MLRDQFCAFVPDYLDISLIFTKFDNKEIFVMSFELHLLLIADISELGKTFENELLGIF